MTGLQPDFVTIIARNYVPAARVLARSLARHHPASLLHVITVDADLAAEFATLDNVRTIAIDDIALPDLGVMALKYEILEFCTAIKPFALSYLLERLEGDALIYLDPDIQVLSPMFELLDALHSSSIVLTPHLLGAVDDPALPGEIEILKTGTYNLGFLALRADAASRDLLAWWSERLFDRCLNDASSGYFVDQRWMELASSLFDGVRILREPGYNIAYWNLHERMIAKAADGYAVCGRPVRFFHFSGYSPAARGSLSRHQTRHDARDHPDLFGLLNDYADALVAEGHPAYAEAPYRFARLANGARVSTPLRRALRVLIDRGVAFPDPYVEPDAFCARLCSPILASIEGPVSPLEWGVEDAGLKPEGGFPDVGSNSPHDAFLAWCRTGPGARLGLPSITMRAVSTLAAERELDRVLEAIDAERPLEQFPGLVVDRDAYQAMIYWAKAFGVARGRWSAAAVAALDALWPQMRRVFNQCVEEPLALDAMKKTGEEAGDCLEAWLLGGFDRMGVTRHAVRLFCAAVRQQPTWFADFALYAAPADQLWPTVFDLTGSKARLHHWGQAERRAGLLLRDGPPLATQFEIWRSNLAALPAAGRACAAGRVDQALSWMDPRAAIEAQALLADPLPETSHERRLNLAGHLAAPTGMGELARALLRTASKGGLEVAPVVIPTTSDVEPLQAFPFAFGVPLPQARFSITAVNAITVEKAVDTLPRHYWADRNIGYWMWETDRLPGRYRQAASAFDEIWTASHSARDAIAASVNVPVEVAPLALDLDALSKATSDKPRFGLPEDAVVFGFMFDFDSVLERKNPLGLIRAFKAAFSDDPAAFLLLKTNGKPPHDYAARQVFQEAQQANIRILSGVRSRAETLDLLASLDVYVSLHRFEGFGLTCAEAMALSKPVIATDHSGNRDFMDAECSMMVPADIVVTKRTFGPYPPGSRWAAPDEAAAAHMMRALMSAAERERVGRAGRERVLAQLSPEAVARRFNQLLER
jgi:glycosyltransferase involved in cell wall biosynthesis